MRVEVKYGEDLRYDSLLTPVKGKETTMGQTVGTCSECGGRVTIPEAWMGVKPPIPRCEKCGATKAQPYGPVVKMQPRPVAGVVNVAARDKSAAEIEAYLRGCRKVIA